MTDLRTSLLGELSSKIKEKTGKMELLQDPVEWIKQEFYIPETKDDPRLRGHLELMPYQEALLREALSRDLNGDFKYSIIIWSDIKKSIKSTIAAAVNLARAHATEWGEFYVVANDLKQAHSRVSKYIRRSIILNPKTNPKNNRDYKVHGYTIEVPSGSVIESIPIDPTGEAGSNADQITWSELWGANAAAQENMWAEMTLSPTKQGRSFRWVESYAGFAEEAELLYSLYEMGVKRGELLWPEKKFGVTGGEPSALEAYVNREARMLCLWNTVPRNPWQTKEYYQVEAATLPPNQFLRMHRNQWVSSTETFVPMEWWQACKRDESDWPEWVDENKAIPKDKPQFKKSRWPVIIALDAAVSGAELGMWMGCRHPDNPEDVLELYAKRWKPGMDGKINFYGTDEHPGLDIEIRRLISQYNVIEIAYDEFQLHSFCQKLKQEGLGWFRSYPQGNERLISDSLFRDMIRERRYWHRGNPDMTEHVGNADAKIDPEDRKVRIVKRTERLNVDLAVCGSMGCRELMRLNL